jgi:D-alanyl-D-alanine carboxypeptidase/D-alanyl-D-alanine-endopeptidase (penicillin-binding protein 4)
MDRAAQLDGGAQPTELVNTEAGGTGLAPTSDLAARALAAHLAQQLRRAGAGSGADVYDLTGGRPLFAERAQTRHPPASVEKLYTATALLDRLGPSARLSTTVLGVGALGAGGTWQGNLYLRGGGDPTFGSQAFIRAHYGGLGASVQALALALVHDGIHRVTGRIYGDESYFDSLRGEPSSDYAFDPYLEGVLSALAFNRGETGPYRGPHAPAQFAAHELASALRADHVAIGAPAAAATTPPGATTLAQVQSPTVTQLLGLTLPPSDNFFAEMLVKVLGVRFGGAGTTAAGASVVTSTLRSLVGIDPVIVDGSGLSRQDLTSPQEVLDLLRYLASSPLGPTIRGALAVAGRSGTLADRMLHSAATDHCEAKTGTLTGVSNLAGYCQAAGGHETAFVFFNDAIPTEAAHAIQDNMTITLARY